MRMQMDDASACVGRQTILDTVVLIDGLMRRSSRPSQRDYKMRCFGEDGCTTQSCSR